MTLQKMKRELKSKYLLDNYWQDVFFKFLNFKWKELHVEH